MSLAALRRVERGPSHSFARATPTYRGLVRWGAVALLLAAGVGCGDSPTAPEGTTVRLPGLSATVVSDPSLSARYPAEWNVYPDSNPVGLEPMYPIRVAVAGLGSEITEQVVGGSGPGLYGSATQIGSVTLTSAAEAAALRALYDVLVITSDPFSQFTSNNATQAGIDAFLDAGGGVLLEDRALIAQLYGSAPQPFSDERIYSSPAIQPGFPVADRALTSGLQGALALGTLTLQAVLHSAIDIAGFTAFLNTSVPPAPGEAPGPPATAAMHTERGWGAGNMGGRLVVQGFALARACTAPPHCDASVDRMLLYNELRWLAKNAADQPPRADAGGNAGAPADVHYAGTEGSPVAFTGYAFDNEFGPAPRLTMTWDFENDGMVDASAPSAFVSGLLEGSRTWPDNGAFTARFSATDAKGVTRSETVPVRVANVAPTVTAGGDVAIEAGRSLTLPASFSDPGADNPWSYTVLWGDEAAGATPVATALQAPGAFSPSHRYATPGVYEVTVEVTDKDGGKGSAALQVTVRPSTNRAPIASAGGPYAGNEGSPITLNAGGSSDPDGDALTYAWDLDNDGAYDDATGATPSATFTDNGTYTVGVQVGDGVTSSAATATVAVANVAPSLGTVSFPTAPVAVGTPVTVSASFTDPGSADTHTAEVQWDVNGVWESIATSGNVASATKTLAAGVYTVTLRVTDDDLGADSETTAGYVVVYDPKGPFVTGGGWINSAGGDCTLGAACLGAAGKATFGFVSKYLPGRFTPSGNTEFEFKAGGFRFRSASYEWLVVAGARAQYKGDGQVDGVAGSYGFLITAVDGAVAGGGGADRFRIKVWDKATAAVVYDNQRGANEDSDAAATLGGGSVVIHK